MIDHGFVRSGHDSCVYVKEVSSGEYVYLLIYVHDMLIAAKSVAEINKIKKDLSEGFEMKDMGAASRILGIDISRNRSEGTLELSQSGYLNRVLDRFHMSEAKGVSTPMGAHFKLASVTSEEECVDTEKVPYASAIGSIMYAMVGTRPDVAQAIGVLSRFMGNPGKVHWTAVKWLLRYLKNSSDLKLIYTQGKDLQVQGYSDSDYAADLDRRRSTTGYVFTIGGNTMSWKSNLQSIVALKLYGLKVC
ncbi:putative RNA-directed DNA polymerase [Arabidopsis thaliana]